MTPLAHPWVKSSYSSQDGGNCVEWSPAHAGAHGAVPVRDSKDPKGPALMFEPAAWSAFVAGVQAGDFPA
ncbi:DUF397 domain-containing protein [Streptomyces sioyaensis]|uniref:DUF397 domain-containing protein n=1 Tax=Streptomyces sioyaensis TaxID=67364 RepID=UPI0036E6558A